MMSQINCEKFSSDLLEARGLDGLSPLHRDHAQGCSSCAEANQQFLRIQSVFLSLPQTEPSLSSLQFVLQKARGQATKPGLWANLVSWADSLLPSSLGAFNWAPAMMVLLLMVSGSFFAQNKSETINLPEQPRLAALKSPSGIRPSYSLFPSGAEQMFSPIEKVALTTGALPSVDTPNVEDFSTPSASEDDLKKALLEEDADNLLMRGRRFKSMGRVDLALKDFETIFHYYPDYTYIGDVLMYRSQCYAFQGNFQKAVESLEIYKRKDPSKAALLEPMINGLRLEQAKNR